MRDMQKVKLQLGSASVQLDASNPRVLLGRDPTCGLPTNEVSVSRRHAEVAFVGDQLVIRDMGSSNGTWINGEPVSADPQPLQPGQQVFLGHIPLLVEWIGGAQGGATVLGEMPAELKALIESRKAAKMAPASPVAAAAAAFQDPPSQGGLDEDHARDRRHRRAQGGRLRLPAPGLEQQRRAADRPARRHLHQRRHHRRLPRVHRPRQRDRRLDLRRAGRVPQARAQERPRVGPRAGALRARGGPPRTRSSR